MIKLKSYLLNDFLSDCIISYTNKEFQVHRVILSVGSIYSYKKFAEGNLPMKDGKFILDFPNKIRSQFSKASDEIEDDNVKIMLKFLYCNQKIKKIEQDLNEENIFSLLSLSHCFVIPKFMKGLAKIISKKILNQNNCARIYYESLMVI